jgi:hypothetical protein
VDVVFTTDSIGVIPDSYIRLPRYLSRVDLDDILLAKPSSFIGLSGKETNATDNEAAFIDVLPADCHKITAMSMFATNGSEETRFTTSIIADTLQCATENVRKVVAIREPEAPISVHLDSLVASNVPTDPLAVLDWKAVSVLPVNVTRLDSTPIFKSTDATYWIVGMAGALGISLCDWMISSGARNIVITTRNPKISLDWIAAHKRRDAIVTVLPW